MDCNAVVFGTFVSFNKCCNCHFRSTTAALERSTLTPWMPKACWLEPSCVSLLPAVTLLSLSRNRGQTGFRKQVRQKISVHQQAFAWYLIHWIIIYWLMVIQIGRSAAFDKIQGKGLTITVLSLITFQQLLMWRKSFIQTTSVVNAIALTYPNWVKRAGSEISNAPIQKAISDSTNQR